MPSIEADGGGPAAPSGAASSATGLPAGGAGGARAIEASIT